MKTQRKKLYRAIASIGAASLCAVAISTPASAGQIITKTETQCPTGGGANGFGGWNLDNIMVLLNPSIVPSAAEFDPATGCYDFPEGTDHTYFADVDNGLGRSTRTDLVLGSQQVGQSQ